MNSKTLISCILLSTLVLFLLSTGTQATEYRGVNEEVKAEDILKHIQNGEDIYLENCSIVGELNLSKIELEIVPNPSYKELSVYTDNEIEINEVEILEDYEDSVWEYGYIEPELNRELKVVESNISVFNCIFEDDLDFSNVLFKKPVSLIGVKYSSKAVFTGSYFYNSTYFGNLIFSDNGECTFSSQETIFNDTTDFSFATFRDNVDFRYATFCSLAKFCCTTFNDTADFYSTNFNNITRFSSANFNDTTDFSSATFNDIADFHLAVFKNTADFRYATFRDATCFDQMIFEDLADFSDVNFKYISFFHTTFEDNSNFEHTIFSDTTCLEEVNFRNFANFKYATFNDNARFCGPDMPENLTLDGPSSLIFIKYYKDRGQYENADTIYYNYRKENQAQKQWYEISKWVDILSWISCGYGVRPFNAFLFGTIVIFLFSFIYTNPISLHKNRSEKTPFRLSWNVSLDKSSNKIILFKFSFKSPGITNSDQIQEASLLDLFYYSTCRFTFMSYDNWYAKDNFRVFAIIEGILGWATLGIFMATLTAELIRV